MYVHVHQLWITINEQRRSRMPIPRQEIKIGPAQRADQQLVFDRPTIHEQILCHGRPTRIGWQGRVSDQSQSIPLGINPQCILGKLCAQNTRQSPMQRIKQITVFRIRPKAHTSFTATRDIAQGEPNKRLCHRKAFDHICDRLVLGPIRPHELQSRRCRVKQIPQFNDCPAAQGRRFHRGDLPARDRNRMAFTTLNARRDRQPPDSP